ncbi:cation transporter, partial [Acinetobacter baumannii]|nr:cation transporter [Acinetobacter baumannii]
LFKLAIKNHDDVKNPQVREAYGKLAGIVGVISNIILCAIKVIAGILSSSISIIADGINNLSDATSSIITLVGFKLS